MICGKFITKELVADYAAVEVYCDVKVRLKRGAARVPRRKNFAKGPYKGPGGRSTANSRFS